MVVRNLMAAIKAAIGAFCLWFYATFFPTAWEVSSCFKTWLVTNNLFHFLYIKLLIFYSEIKQDNIVVVKHIYILQKKRSQRMKKAGKIEKEDSKMTAGWIMFKSAFLIMYNQVFHINEGDDIPSDIDLVDLDSGSKVTLRRLCTSSTPLILNFGSCT